MMKQENVFINLKYSEQFKGKIDQSKLKSYDII